MQIEIHCPSCTRKYSITEDHIGRRVVCADTSCGTRFIATTEQSQEEVFGAEVYFEAAENSVELPNVEPVQANHLNTSSTASVHDQTEHGTTPSQVDDTAAPSELLCAELDGGGGQETQTGLALDGKERSGTKFWGMAKKALGDASTHVSNTGVAVTSKAVSYGSTGIAKATEVGKQTLNTANSAIDSSGVKDAVKATASVVSGKLDEVSGKRLVELLEKKLQIQDSYNDILATRLAEALDRISALEDRLNIIASQSAVNQIPTAETP